jgi:hypothetical protein
VFSARLHCELKKKIDLNVKLKQAQKAMIYKLSFNCNTSSDLELRAVGVVGGGTFGDGK